MLGIAALCWGAAAQAQLFKCVGADGKTSYQSEACPTTAKEQRLKADTAPTPSEPLSASSPAGAGTLPGWDRGEILFMQDQCVKSYLLPAQKEFEAASQPFPDAKLVPPMENHCGCIAQRAATKWTFLVYSRNPVQLTRQLTDEALKGGECAPGGEFADLLRKSGKMR
jgi:hypothetical protein